MDDQLQADCQGQSKTTTGSLPPIRVAYPRPIPTYICKCPECGGRLYWQVTTSDGLRDLDIDCENDEEPSEGMTHRYWQSDWQPIIDKVRRYLTLMLTGLKKQRAEAAGNNLPVRTPAGGQDVPTSLNSRASGSSDEAGVA